MIRIVLPLILVASAIAGERWVGTAWTGHEQFVSGIGVMPDGRHVVSVSGDDSLRLWDITGRELRRTMVKGRGIGCVAISADGKWLTTGQWDGTVQRFNTSTLERAQTIPAHRENVLAVSISPDGKTIVSGSGDDTLALWEASTGKLIHRFEPGNDYDITAIAFSPDGKLLAAGDGDGVVTLYSVADRDEVRSLTGHRLAITSLAVSPEGNRLVTGSRDDTVRLWDVATGKELLTLKGHTDDVTSVAFSPDGKLIASASDDGTWKLWQTDTGEVRVQVKADGPIASIQFGTDGRMITAIGKSVTIWSLRR